VENILLVQEEIHSCISREEQGFILKLNMANAFNRVRHSFFFVVLKIFSFANEFVGLIRACINRPWIVALVNERLSHLFQSTRGIRKGCPFSPFLYLLMEKSLNRKLE